VSFAETCRKVAEQFIRTVVVIDDRGFAEPPPDAIVHEAVPPDSRGYEPPSNEPRAADSADVESGCREPPGDPDPIKHDLDGMGLTRCFARMGINCAIYVPDPDETFPSGAEPGGSGTARILARRADIVVVDWLLDGRNSKQARELIRRTLEDDRLQGGRLRLMAVYTGADNLKAHRQDVRSDLAKAGMQLRDDDSEGVLALSGPQLRIVFFHKDHDLLPVREHVVSEADLPGRLVGEFARMTEGVMPSIALAAISAVRDGTHNILAKFGRSLDPALAAHRSMLKTPSDAEDYALRLVSEELQVRLEGTWPERFRPTAAVFGDWVDHLSARGMTFNLTGKPEHQILPDVVKALLVNGAADHGPVSTSVVSNPVSKSKVWQHLTNLFSSSPKEAELANLMFARMALLRREAYGTPELPQGWLPTLTLGTIVVLQPSSSGCGATTVPEYYLCLQPRCDAVRLSKERPFPFLPLDVREDASVAFSLVVRVREGRDLRLQPRTSPYEIQMIDFAPTADLGLVRGERGSEGFRFRDVQGRLFEWLGEMRPSAAQRVAQQMSSQFGRVGLDEFEWLRLNAER